MKIIGVSTLQQKLDDFFSHHFRHSQESGSNVRPIVREESEAKESADAYTMIFHVPQLNKNYIKTKINGKTLVISCKPVLTRGKILDPGFKQTFVLPDNVNCTQIRSDYQNGFLTITIPKLYNSRDQLYSGQRSL